MPRELSDRGTLLLDDLPPFLQRSVDIQGTVDALARELVRLEDAIANVRANFWPNQAEDYIAIWEFLLGLTVDPPDKTLAQRQSSVLAFFRKLKSSGSRQAWEDAITELIGTGWSYTEHDPGDPASPDPYVVEVALPFVSPIAIPTGLGATAGGGGALSAGTYYYAVTAANIFGETPTSDVVNATVGASGSVALNWNDVAGADSYRVYRGTTATALRRLDLGSTLTVSAYTDNGSATPTSIPPPNTNTTGSFQSHEAHKLLRKITPAHIELVFSFETGFVLGSSELGDFL